jgi:carbamoyl-phosphate synthase small subunit
MTGYQEICTDPSYRGQMVVLTYPLIGNYGVAPEDVESRRPWLSALIVHEHCNEFTGWRASESLDAYLARNGIPGICDLDTRALTRHLRTHGTQRGIIRAYPPGAEVNLPALLAEARAVRSVSELDVVGEVALDEAHQWTASDVSVLWPATTAARASGQRRARVVVIDTGYKENIARSLAARGLEVYFASRSIDLPRLLSLDPDGVLLSNGPGDPETQADLVALVREIVQRRLSLPVLGICLGHQIIGLGAGATTSRLPFGHHGANHPVLEQETGRVVVTTQNHNFQVDADSLPAESGFRISHINLSDGSVEGLVHQSLPIFSVQFHPEACPGPEDSRDIFDRFAQVVGEHHLARHETAVAV